MLSRGTKSANSDRRKLRKTDRFYFSQHVLDRTRERGLSIATVEKALKCGKWYPIEVGFRCVFGSLQVILARDGVVVTAYST